MLAVVQAVPEVERRTDRPVIVAGGLAVVCRLAQPHRVTYDLDTVNRRAVDEPSDLEVLVASGGQRDDASGVLIETPVGRVKVDVLEITDADLDPLPDDPNDRLYVTAHAWGAETASAVHITASGTSKASAVSLRVRVAEPGPLVAMKLQAVMNRPAAKEGTDLLDIVRLVLDRTAGPVALDQLALSDNQLAKDALIHAQMWFVDQADRSLRRVRAVGGDDVTFETLSLTADLLGEVLTR